jgi:hypothetical protein
MANNRLFLSKLLFDLTLFIESILKWVAEFAKIPDLQTYSGGCSYLKITWRFPIMSQASEREQYWP